MYAHSIPPLDIARRGISFSFLFFFLKKNNNKTKQGQRRRRSTKALGHRGSWGQQKCHQVLDPGSWTLDPGTGTPILGSACMCKCASSAGARPITNRRSAHWNSVSEAPALSQARQREREGEKKKERKRVRQREKGEKEEEEEKEKKTLYAVSLIVRAWVARDGSRHKSLHSCLASLVFFAVLHTTDVGSSSGRRVKSGGVVWTLVRGP